MTKRPRNPLVAAARFRLAGPHQKTEKARRRHEKVQLNVELRQMRRSSKKTEPDFLICSCL